MQKYMPRFNVKQKFLKQKKKEKKILLLQTCSNKTF